MKLSSGVPELILVNGRFRTLDPARPLVQALAIAGGRILAVGDTADIRALAAPSTREIDVEGKLGLPGFRDSHFHFRDYSLGQQQLDLAKVGSFDEFEECLRHAAAQSQGRGEDVWVLGQGWNETDWPEGRAPFRQDLDAALPDIPALLWRCDLHLAVANSKALELAGIGPDTANPPEGEIGRDEHGRPNGHLREQAINLVRRVLPPATDEQLAEAMRQGMKALNAMGMTGIHDVKLMAEAEATQTLRVWQTLREAGDMSLRAWVAVADSQLDSALRLGLRTGLGDEWLRIGHVKFFADGGMGARTAWMLDPFLDAGTGLPLWDMAELAARVDQAEAGGLSVMIHAIGNRATREIIKLFDELERKRPADRRRPRIAHRIEHLQMVEREDLERLSGLPLAVCMQPHNMILDINMIDRSLAERGERTYPFREVLEAGVPLMFSSDAPVCDPRPLVGVHAAVTRRRPDGSPAGGWHAQHVVDVEAAVRAYTSNPAEHYAEDDLGGLSPGKRADLVLLDQDIFEIDPMGILETKILLTMVGGRVVHG